MVIILVALTIVVAISAQWLIRYLVRGFLTNSSFPDMEIVVIKQSVSRFA